MAYLRKPRTSKAADLDLQSELNAAYTDAATYIDDEIAPERELATLYYRAHPSTIPYDEGRSKIVLSEVRDTVLRILPGLQRVFLSTDNVFEFTAAGPEDEDDAEQATILVNHALLKDNPGYRILTGAMKDALIRKAGVVKWWWQDDHQRVEEEYEGLTPEIAQVLRLDPELEVLEEKLVLDGKVIEPSPLDQQIEVLMGQPVPPYPPMVGDASINMRVRRTRRKGKAVVALVPPEEFLIDRGATGLQDAEYAAHRRFVPISTLVAMGYDYDELVANSGNGDAEFETNKEYLARRPDRTFRRESDTADPTMRKVLYCEHYIRRDLDGDGIAELIKACTIGGHQHILYQEVVPEAPFALFEVDPEPHVPFGTSVADRLIDLQTTKSVVMRTTLDAAQHAITPRTVVVENEVELDDLLNLEVGAIIRARQPGMVQELRGSFDGQSAIGLLGYLDEVKAGRTGISRATMGLEASALQSTTKAAVEMQRASGEDQQEMIARNLAEGGFRDLARGLLRLIVRHQDQPRQIRIKNRFVQMDPRSWNADMDVSIKVGLGNGGKDQRMAFLMQIAQTQREALTQMGPDNPLTSIAHLRNTLEEVCGVMGFKDASRFFKEITPEAMQQMAQPNQNPDPNMELVKVEAEKVRAEMEIARLKLELEREKAKAEDDRVRDKAEMDAAIKRAEIEARYGAQLSQAELNAIATRERDAMNAAVQADNNLMQAEVAAMQAMNQPNPGAAV